MTTNKISLHVRLRIFQALVAPIFLYNSELWTVKHREKKKIDTFQRSFLRQIVRTRKKTSDLYQICQTIPWSVTIQEKRLKWFGHLHRLPEGAPARVAYEEATKKPAKKLKGGQPLNWHRIIERDLNSIDTTTHKAIQLARDRIIYNREVVDRVMAKALSGTFPESEFETDSSAEE